MIRGAGHGLISASARKINDDDPTFSLFALLIGGIEQKRGAEGSRSADHGGAHVGQR